MQFQYLAKIELSTDLPAFSGQSINEPISDHSQENTLHGNHETVVISNSSAEAAISVCSWAF